VCEPGFDMVSVVFNLKVADPVTTFTTKTVQSCVKKGDKIKGCNGVTIDGYCSSCDYRAGYHAKDVGLTNWPSSQGQVCKHETEEGTYGDLGEL